MPDDQQVTVPVPSPAATPDLPQFSTAEYADVPGTERCRVCGSVISGEYYRVNTQMACAKCAGEAKQGQPTDSHAAFARGLLFGIGAAVLGMVLYATVVIATGWTIGYLALAVGFLVAKGMMKGSNGMGGRKYQIAAVLLTYASISMSAIPIGLAYFAKHGDTTPAQSQRAAEPSDTEAGTTDASPAPSEEPRAKRSPLGLLGQLVFLGLASPFLELQNPGSGLIGLVILFVGLSIAFRMTAAKPLEVDGPYRLYA